MRQEQLKILQASLQQRFEDAMASHLGERFAGWPEASDPQVRVLIREGIELASKYGINHRYDLRRFLEFRTEYGPGFDAIPWIAKILNDRTLSGCGKMEQIDLQSLFAMRQ